MQEAVDMESGAAYVVHEEISASRLITLGIDLEDQQYVQYFFFILSMFIDISRRRLAIDIADLGLHATDIQRMKVQVRTNTLRRRITSWTDIQHLYIPTLRIVRARLEANLPTGQHEEPAHSVPLFLPSSITPRSRVACDVRLSQMEWDLRFAQANDALDELRDGLRLRSYLFIDKDRFQRGQHQNTRARGVIDRTEVKIKAAAAKYRAAREALKSLAGSLLKIGWDATFPVLLVTDIRGLSDVEEISAASNSINGETGSGISRPGAALRGTLRGGTLRNVSRRSRGRIRSTVTRPSEGRRSLSWIWLNLGELEDTDELLQDGA